MDLRFINLIKSFFPKGVIWDFQKGFNDLIEGFAVEFGRSYDTILKFFNDFNIVNSTNLAVTHSKDYLITLGLFTPAELQEIIVNYLNKDLDIKEVIEDFATFIGANIEFGIVVAPFMAGRSTTGNRLGDPAINNTRMLLFIKFLDVDDVANIAKIKNLVDFLKPPYINIVYNDTNTNINTPFIAGRNTTGNPLGIIT